MNDKRIRFFQGEIILKENEASSMAYLVIRGQVGVYLRTNGKQSIVPLGIVKAGELVGEMGIIASIPRTAEAVALGDVEVLRIDKSSLEDELEKMPTWIQAMIVSLAERIVHMDNMIRTNKFVDKTLLDKINQALVPPEEEELKIAS